MLTLNTYILIYVCMININIGKNIKRIRQELGFTQAQVAFKLKLPRERISAIESSKTLHLNTISRLAKALGVEPYQLLMSTDKDAA